MELCDLCVKPLCSLWLKSGFVKPLAAKTKLIYKSKHQK